MSLIKKIKDKFSQDYHSRREYILAKLFVAILFLPIIIWLLLGVISGIINGDSVVVGVFEFLFRMFVLVLFRLFLDGIVESIFLKSGKIVANMKELPRGDGGKNTIIQYDLPGDITPSEAGMLLYGRAEISNLLCLIYKWVNEKNVNLYIENGKKYLEKKRNLGEEKPDYEKFLFTCLFKYRKRPIPLDKKLLKEYVSQFSDMVVRSCMRKGYIDNKIDLKGINRFFVSGKDISSDKPIAKRNPSIGCLLVALFVPGLPLASNLGIVWFLVLLALIMILSINYVNNTSYFINFTEKGKEVISQIYGYKYYLEHCEEEQINSDLGDGEIYSKHLPYAIALKLNWKMIDELS